MDIQRLRERFAGLDSDVALFDNAGGSQILRSVIRRISEYYEDCNVQHGASYSTSRRAVERVAEARAAMATWVNAADPSEIVLGPSTTQLARILAESIGRNLGPSDEVIVTNCDHEANIGPWVELERLGVKLKTWSVDPIALELRLDDLQGLMTDRTRLVAWTHASNVLGRINPTKAFAEFVRERGALSCVDGVAFAPHRAIDVRDLGIDFYLLSLYKLFGPHLAMLYGRRQLLLELPAVNHFFIAEDDLPYKFQPGGANYELSSSLVGLWDYVEEVDSWLHPGGAGSDRRAKLERVFTAFAEREAILAEKVLSFLRTKSTVRIVGPQESDPAHRVSTVSFAVEGRASEEIVLATDKAKVAIRYGDFYAHRLIDDLGLRPLGGIVRASFLHYNTEAEVDRLLEVLDQEI
jgi:cysteine desulfurase family protein (TIGR01976 family)